MLLILVFSFLQRGTYGGLIWNFSFDNFINVFDPSYFLIIFQSVLLALATTILCFIFALPLTWKISSLPAARKNLFLFLVCLPFFMNSLARIYGLKLWFHLDGPLDQLIQIFSLPFDILNWSHSQGLVLFGMTITYLPFMIFPVYAAFEKLDFSLIEAAEDLGAHSFQIFYKVLLPVLKKPILNGALIVFVPCLGEYLIPDLLGGAKNMLVGNLTTELFLKSRDWPLGAALTVVLLVILAVAHKLVGKAVPGKKL